MAGRPGADLFQRLPGSDDPTIVASRDARLLYREQCRERVEVVDARKLLFVAGSNAPGRR
jgi:hypothetical protein